LSGTRYVFLTAAEAYPSTVFASQVADLLRVLAGAGLRFDVLGFDPYYARNRHTAHGRAAIAELEAKLPGALRLFPYVPFEDRVGVPLARRLLAWELRDRRPTVIHARGVWAAATAARVARGCPWIKLLYDVRGDYVAEHAFHRAGRGDARGLRIAPGQWRIGRAEARAVSAATRILCVSRPLRGVLDGRYPSAGVKTVVIPGSHDPATFRRDPELRERTRDRLGLQDRFVVAYAGSMVPYQLPESLAACGKIACELREDAHLLVLTQDPERARDVLESGGVPTHRATVRHVPHREVPALLNAADLGLLLRRRDPVNRAASPTKVAEYLACGVPLVVGPEIGDTSDLVRQEGLGAVVEDCEDLGALRAALTPLLVGDALPKRGHVAGVARQRLARDRFLPVYLDLYGQLSAAAQRAVERP
jgi:glycosyltransferase involved in cell wall biosynthesis